MNRIDHLKHTSKNFEQKYDDEYGHGLEEFISYQVNKMEVFWDDLQKVKLNKMVNWFIKELFNKGFHGEIDDSIDVSVYNKQRFLDKNDPTLFLNLN